MGILIDSDVLITIERNKVDVFSFIRGREDEEMFLSVVSASELLRGVYHATEPAIRSKRLAFVEAVLSAFPVLDIDLATARSHAQLWSDLEKAGIMIGFHDSWLAATCLAHGLAIVTNNVSEFARIPELRIESWK